MKPVKKAAKKAGKAKATPTSEPTPVVWRVKNGGIIAPIKAGQVIVVTKTNDDVEAEYVLKVYVNDKLKTKKLEVYARTVEFYGLNKLEANGVMITSNPVRIWFNKEDNPKE